MNIKVPKNQILWLTYCNENQEPQYIVTSDIQQTKYTLYRVLKDYAIEKIKTSKEPTFREVGY
jgi:hypothetical protein